MEGGVRAPMVYYEPPGERKMIGFSQGERKKFYGKMQETRA